MDADLAALPDDIDALKATLALERVQRLEADAHLAVAQAKASADAALIAHQKLRIAEMLGEDEDWLWDVANEMDQKDGLIWVYGIPSLSTAFRRLSTAVGFQARVAE